MKYWTSVLSRGTTNPTELKSGIRTYTCYMYTNNKYSGGLSTKGSVQTT